MLEINARIVKQKILRVDIAVPREMSGSIELNISCRAQVKTPCDNKDRSVLLNVELEIHTPENELKILFDADTLFELDNVPEDYNVLAEKELIPMARTSLMETLDDILVKMGHRKMHLSEKI